MIILHSFQKREIPNERAVIRIDNEPPVFSLSFLLAVRREQELNFRHRCVSCGYRVIIHFISENFSRISR